MARTPTAIRKQALFGIATVNSFGRAKPIVFDERVLAPKRRAGMGRLRIGTPFGTSSTIKLTEPYETGALLPMQQIHPLLGSVMT